jgi:dienelactone hydrolase
MSSTNNHRDDDNQDDGCCPPGSHGAPVTNTAAQQGTTSVTLPAGYFDESPKGEFMTLEGGGGGGNGETSTSTSTPCYYSSPVSPPSCHNSSGLIIYPDVWGFQSRILRIADLLAETVPCHVLVVDCFRGETKDTQPDMKAWFQRVSYDSVVKPDTDVCVKFLKEQKNVTEFGALGFCWGAWAIAKTCQQQVVLSASPWKVVVSPHPSFRVEKMAFDGDDVSLMQSIHCPVLLLPAANDPEYTKPESDEFQSMPNPTTSRSIEFRDMSHGWTTRGDLSSDPKLKRDLDESLREIRAYIQKYLFVA